MPGPDYTNLTRFSFYHFIHTNLMADEFTASALNMHFSFCCVFVVSFVVSSHCAVLSFFLHYVAIR